MRAADSGHVSVLSLLSSPGLYVAEERAAKTQEDKGLSRGDLDTLTGDEWYVDQVCGSGQLRLGGGRAGGGRAEGGRAEGGWAEVEGHTQVEITAQGSFHRARTPRIVVYDLKVKQT